VLLETCTTDKRIAARPDEISPELRPVSALEALTAVG
jgi:hypothetical protein